MKKYKKMPNIDLGHYMLRTIKLSDYKDMFVYGSNQEVTKYLTWGPFIDPLEAKMSIRHIFYPRIKQGLPMGYAIVDIHQNKMIGTIDFHSKPEGTNQAEIGYVIHQAYWNQGIMTKALKALLDIGFDYLKYDKITVRHISLNKGSERVIQKVGFKFKNKVPYVLEKSDCVIKDYMLNYELTKEQYYGT